MTLFERLGAAAIGLGIALLFALPLVAFLHHAFRVAR